jgi:hypothetical protein
MMRHILIMVTIVAFAAQTFNRSFIIFNYYTNIAAFEKACENKARPLLKCQGKCQLMKKLKAEEKKEEQNPERKAENKNEYLLSATHAVLSFMPALKGKIIYQHFIPASLKWRSFAVFHPPALV